MREFFIHSRTLRKWSVFLDLAASFRTESNIHFPRVKSEEKNLILLRILSFKMVKKGGQMMLKNAGEFWGQNHFRL